MGKKNRSITVSEENDEFLRNHPNASALIDDLVGQVRDGSNEQAISRYRIRQLEAEIEECERKAEFEQRNAELKREQIEEIKSDMEDHDTFNQAVYEQARENMSTIPKDMFTVDNNAITKYANQLGMTPVELHEKLQNDPEFEVGSQ